jgi:ATP-dependent Clp protease ATP-binding subunit ClpA
MFERYTERARRVLFFARYEASELGSRLIEPEHLLLGVIREGKGASSQMLARAHLLPADLRRKIGDRVTRLDKQPTSREIPFSDQAKHILQRAASEADRLLENHIGTEHLLLGIIAVDGTVPQALLTGNGMDLETARENLIQIKKESAAGQPTKSRWLRPETKSVLQFAVEEADRVRHTDIRVEELLVGILKEGQTAAARLLMEHGVSLEVARSLTSLEPKGPSLDLATDFAPAENLPAEWAHQIPLFSKYTERALRVLLFAEDQVRQRGLLSIDSDGLFVGLLREREGLARTILDLAGLSPDLYDAIVGELSVSKSKGEDSLAARNQISTRTPSHLEFTDESLRVFKCAADEAQRLLHNYIGAEHLLLGLLRSEGTMAGTVLRKNGVRLDNSRVSLVILLSIQSEFGVNFNRGFPIAKVPGPSRFWKCPNCGGVPEKSSAGEFSRYSSISGTATCGGCQATFEQRDVYGGRYDLSEIQFECPHCSTTLRGPRESLLGHTCPGCGKRLPE